jgi:hypothetical protein
MPLIRKGKMEMRKNKAGRKLFGGKRYLAGFSLWRGRSSKALAENRIGIDFMTRFALGG